MFVLIFFLVYFFLCTFVLSKCLLKGTMLNATIKYINFHNEYIHPIVLCPLKHLVLFYAMIVCKQQKNTHNEREIEKFYGLF